MVVFLEWLDRPRYDWLCERYKHDAYAYSHADIFPCSNTFSYAGN